MSDRLEVLGAERSFEEMPTSKLVLTSNEAAEGEAVNAMKAAIRVEFGRELSER